MKVNFIMALLGLAAAAIIAYAFNAAGTMLGLTITTGVSSAVLLVFGTAVTVADYPRVTMMLRTSAWVAFLLLIVINILLAVFLAGETICVIVDGIFLIASVALLYKVGTTKV